MQDRWGRGALILTRRGEDQGKTVLGNVTPGKQKYRTRRDCECFVVKLGKEACVAGQIMSF